MCSGTVVELDTINEFSDLLRTKNLPYDARSSLIAARKPSTRMDVAKRLAEWRDQPPEQWFTTANRYLPPGVTAVLVIAIAYQLSTLTWTLVPGSMPVAAPAPRSVDAGGAAPASDYSVLTNSHLFGEAAEQAAGCRRCRRRRARHDAEPHAQRASSPKRVTRTAASLSRAIAASRRPISSASRSTARTAPRCIRSTRTACC